MRFGNSAVVRAAHPSNLVVHTGGKATAVRVGAGPRFTRVGADPNAQEGYEQSPLAPDPNMRYRPMGSTRASVDAGATATFLFTPCDAAYLQNLVIPESFALDFTIMSIKVCRVELIESGEIPAESLSNQGGTHLNRLMFGLKVYPAIPLSLVVRNDSAAAKFFNATIFVSSSVSCG